MNYIPPPPEKKMKEVFLVFEPVNNHKLNHYAAGPALFRLHPKKNLVICILLTNQLSSKAGRNHFPKNSCRVIKDLGILAHKKIYRQNRQLRFKAIVHTFYFLLLSYFNVMAIF